MKKLLSVLVMAIMFFTIPITAFAASVGEALLQPEAGWKRIDDSDSRISYFGGWGTDSMSQRWNGSIHYIHGNLSEEKTYITFKFTGTKLRLIDEPGNLTTKNAVIRIDGVDYPYSSYRADVSSYNPIFRGLSFEKTGLENRVHDVKIFATTPGYFHLDAIDLDETGDLVDVNQPTDLKATPGNAQVILTWNAVDKATGYNVKRSTIPGGPYTNIAQSVTGTTYTDTTVTNGTKYYYVITANLPSGEGPKSNEASATPQAPVKPDPEPETGGRAILTIIMTTGLEKEYDLSMTEVNAFIDWYEAKSNGTGSAKFAINKHDNNKGPFSSRKDYVIFDKILTFEVSEYKTK